MLIVVPLTNKLCSLEKNNEYMKPLDVHNLSGFTYVQSKT